VRTTTVVVGAGQGGLAMSHCLGERSIEHVVLERGEVANAWRTQRWNSLRLLTPNWQCRLPGRNYNGDDPDGFMTSSEVADFITAYARNTSAPVLTGVNVVSVRRDGLDGYRVRSDEEEWECDTVVLASGAFNRSHVPEVAAAIPSSVHQVTALDYRSPDGMPEGGVLVVGASATGVQLAHEIHLSGRPVTLSVGEHVRAPRDYRGHDIHWWMNLAGVLDERYDEVDDIVRARRVPSMQLAGTDERADFDLNSLTAIGVKIVGKLAAVRDGVALFSGSLRNKCELADLKLGRLLNTIDEWASANDVTDCVLPPHRFEPTRVPSSPTLMLDLGRGGISTVVWASGFRPDYSWLDVDVLDAKGMVRHDGGAVDAPGLYLIGTPFLRRRKSSFIDGACDDAGDLVEVLAGFLDRRAARRGRLSDDAGQRSQVLPRPADAGDPAPWGADGTSGEAVFR
jgi:putative flavoprotein involved in K+ transport